MKLKKENLKPTLVLGAICLIVALLMAVVNMVTAPEIEERTEAAIAESLAEAMPGGEFGDPMPMKGTEPETVTAIYEEKNGVGYVVTLSTKKGYTGNAILLTVGIDNNGVITGAVVTANPETKGVEAIAEYFAGYKDNGLDETIGVELVSGVTYSSTAIKNATLDAYRALGYEVPEAEVAGRIENLTPWSAVGAAIVLLAIGGAVAYIIVKRRKGI